MDNQSFGKEVNKFSFYLFLMSQPARASTYDGTNRGARLTKLVPVSFSFYPTVQHGLRQVPCQRELTLEERTAPL